MSNSSKKVFALGVAALVALSIAGPASAAEGETGRSITGFFKKLFNYPAKATKETAGMTANTLQNTGEKVVAKTGENTAEVLSGKLEETPNIVGDAAAGSAQTVGQTASETAQIPVKSAEEEQAAS